MNSSLKQQPLIAEVLPGLAVLAVLAVSYCVTHPQQLSELLHLPSAGVIVTGIGVGGFFLSWIIGTFLDAVRNACEALLDMRWPIDWSFLFTASVDEIKKLDDSFLAYYFLDGNYVAGFAILLILKGLGLVHIPLLPLGIVFLIFLANATFLRIEIKNLIDRQNEQRGNVGPHWPHIGVYTRLAPSQIHQGGIGVMAIRDIKEGTSVFEPDDDDMVWVESGVVGALPAQLRKLYDDFAVIHDHRYGCPRSFNKLTIAWYLNSSKNPNVASDADYKFYAVRDIAQGEELTADYDTYSNAPESLPKTPASVE